MRLRKLGAVAVIGTIATGIIGSFATLKAVSNVKADQTYSLSLDSTTSISWADSSFSTGSGSSLNGTWFDFGNAMEAEGNLAILQNSTDGAGYIYNTTAITGATSIIITFEDGDDTSNIALSASLVQNNGGTTLSLTTSSSTKTATYSGALSYYRYFYIENTATTDITISSIQFFYSCSETVSAGSLSTLNTYGGFESGSNSFTTLSGDSTYVSIGTTDAYEGSDSLIVNTYSAGDLVAKHYEYYYPMGTLPAGDYTFVVAMKQSCASTAFSLAGYQIALENSWADSLVVNQNLSYSSGVTAAKYEGSVSGWCRATCSFSLDKAITDAIFAIVIDGDFNSFYTTSDALTTSTWVNIDAIEVVNDSEYLEPVSLSIPDCSLGVGDTLTTATAGATVFNYSYPDITASNIVFSISSGSSYISLSSNVLTATAAGSATIIGTISYGASLTASATFTATITSVTGNFLTSLTTINSAGKFYASDWTFVTAGWKIDTTGAVTTAWTNGNYSKDGDGQCWRVNGIAASAYESKYISGIYLKSSKTYTFTLYYYNAGSMSVSLRYAASGTTGYASATSIASKTVSTTWATSWNALTWTLTPTSDLSNYNFFMVVKGSSTASNNYGYFDALSVTVA